MPLFRSGDIVTNRRLSSDERRRPSAVEECRQLTNTVSSSGSFGSDYQRWLSKSDTWSRHHRGVSGAEGGATECGGRRKMSESAVLALIREQSTSRDDSENSSSQRGTVQSMLCMFVCLLLICYVDDDDKCCTQHGLPCSLSRDDVACKIYGL